MDDDSLSFLVALARIPAEERESWLRRPENARSQRRLSGTTRNVLKDLLGESHGSAAARAWRLEIDKVAGKKSMERSSD